MLFRDCIVIYHRVHISRRHQKSQSRLSKYLNTLLLSPVRLRNDPHFIPTTLQQSADDRSTKGRMVHVGITCNIGKIYLLHPLCFISFFVTGKKSCIYISLVCIIVMRIRSSATQFYICSKPFKLSFPDNNQT